MVPSLSQIWVSPTMMVRQGIPGPSGSLKTDVTDVGGDRHRCADEAGHLVRQLPCELAVQTVLAPDPRFQRPSPVQRIGRPAHAAQEQLHTPGEAACGSVPGPFPTGGQA